MVNHEPLLPGRHIRSHCVNRVSPVCHLECVIDAEGAARGLSIHESSHRAFNNAALHAISRARFQPATKGGQPVAARAHIPFRFEAPVK